MCGFVGQITKNFESIEKNLIDNSYLICRGPDEHKNLKGKFYEYFNNQDENGYNFQFNRLAILDLSASASQPMISNKYKTILMFNGEIYNHRELKIELKNQGLVFNSSHSDTEVILNGVSAFGANFIKKLRGQFAIAFYESNCKKLTLVRDRLGQKPLFYKFTHDNVIFSSNLKSIVSPNDLLNQKSIEDYLNYGVIPSPNTIYQNIYKLEPAQIITFDLSNNYKVFDKQYYWKIDDYLSDQNFVLEEFFNIFSESIQIREDADVEIATFLSGGIDSTSIVKNMFDRNREINTFSIGYVDPKYDESKWSSLVAMKYQTNHQLETIDIKYDFEEILNSIDIFDEPYSDPSTYPSYIIAKKISEKYKVAISGDGGDELLGGYKWVSQLINSTNRNNPIFNYIYNIYPGFLGTGNRLLLKGSNLLKARTSFYSDKKLLNLLGVKDNETLENNFLYTSEDLYKSLLVSDYKFFLSEMMLLKLDRTSMANSLEVRSPFVDHKLIEYVLSHNANYYSHNSQKKILKNYLLPDFDSSFTNRNKQGFVFNIENYIFDNKNLIFDSLLNNSVGIDTKDLKKFSKYKSRINALRIWKIFFLNRYLSSIQ